MIAQLNDSTQHAPGNASEAQTGPARAVADGRRFPPDRPAWKKLSFDLGRRAVGRLAVGLNGVFGSKLDGRFGILSLHRVEPRVPGFPPPHHNVEPKRFCYQLEGLVARGFTFLPLSTILAAAQRGETFPSRTLVLTFDDGFASVYKHAWPVLSRLRIPATVFVSTAYLDSDEPFPFDAWGVAHQGRVPTEAYRPLRTSECREMAASGLIEIGAHTHTHEDFRGRPDAFRIDLLRSVEIVRERFGIDEVTFAFPYGGVAAGFAGEELARVARDTGVTCGLTTTAALVDPSDSPFHWGRLDLSPWDTPCTLVAKLDGWYEWAPKLQRRVAAMLRAASGSRKSN
jgi:peptidoglycan/xylan/chitin deacetylase (PgdA/CDA1 family)